MKLCKKMKLCKTSIAFLFFLFAIPAYSQKATLGIDVGQTSDKFGGLARTTSVLGDLEGKFTIIERADKEGDPNLVAGGEIRVPADTSSHASEFAVFAGPEFHFGSHFMAGFHAQVRKVYLPSSEVSGQFFDRDKMLLFELPAVVEYKFGSPAKHVFIQAQVSPEFSPHFTVATSPPPSPNPNLDHGYTIRGIAGYNFGRWYARATYETRYFQFKQNLGNPNGLYNWRTDAVTGGIGFSF